MSTLVSSDTPICISQWKLSFHTALTPFHSNAAGSLYTSQNSLRTRDFGYTYPEVVDWNTTPDQLSANVKTTVNNLYGPNAPKRRRALDTKSNYQYFINIKFDSTQLYEPLQIHFFVGTVPQSSNSWATAPNLVGTFPAMSHTDNTQVGQVVLTNRLNRVQIPTLSPRNVVPYLQNNLKYRVVNSNNTEVDARDVPDLKIAVVGQLITQPAAADQFPTYGPLIEFAQATQNIPGGLREGETMQ